MKFDLITFMLDQYILMFVSVATGMILGKILKIGTSGTLFTGLGMGWAVQNLAYKTIAAGEVEVHVKAAQKLLKISVVEKNFFLMFLILFVAAVGLLAADRIAIVIKKYGAKFMMLGFLLTFIGAGTTYFLTIMAKGANPYEVSGVYTGALTSSPGLAAAIEAAREHAASWAKNYENQNDNDKQRLLNILEPGADLTPEDVPVLTEAQMEKFVVNAEAGVGVGYAVGYPFGVIIVILTIRLFPKLFRLDINEEYEKFNAEMASGNNDRVKAFETTSFDTGAFMFCCVVGYFIGKIKVYIGSLGYFGLGSTGGVLIASLTLGYIGKLGFMSFRMDKKVLGSIRDVALTMFLAIVGLKYGFSVIDSLVGSGLYLSFVSLMVGMIAMTAGFIVGKYILGINWIMLSGAVCGGMTSTPGLGVAIDAIGNDDPAAGYGATYPFALFGMVLFTIILLKLPM